MNAHLGCHKLSHVYVHSSKTHGRGHQDVKLAEAEIFLHQALLSLLIAPQSAHPDSLCLSPPVWKLTFQLPSLSLCRFSEPAWSQRAEGRGPELPKSLLIPFEGWKLPEKKRKRLGREHAWKGGSGEHLALFITMETGV